MCMCVNNNNNSESLYVLDKEYKIEFEQEVFMSVELGGEPFQSPKYQVRGGLPKWL